jgi:HK97 family phage major capsid protein
MSTDGATLVINEATVEAFARIFKEEHLKLLGTDLAQAIAKAKMKMDRDKVAALETLGRPSFGDRPRMEKEQLADWLRVVLYRSVGAPATPKANLDADGIITQALTSGVGSAGGFLVPDEFVGEVEKRALLKAVVWPRLRMRPTRSNSVTKPELTSANHPDVNVGAAAKVNSATTTDEIAVTQPVFTQLTWTLRDFDARMPLKLDLVSESPINVMAELLDIITDSFARKREYMPLLGAGSGSSEPLGLLDSGAGLTAVAISAAPTVANILDLIGQLSTEYGSGAVALMSRSTLFAVAAEFAKNVQSAQYLATILPPMLEAKYMTDGKILAGDLNYYVGYHHDLLQILTSIVAERKTQEIVVTEKWDGKPTVLEAFIIGTGVTY